ncbi:MAG: N-acetylmuramoyl-L-alanine amidase family protein, partial [Frankiaceae bacterium]
GPLDQPPDEPTRAATANALRADLLLSVHSDGCASPAPNGLATYFYGDRSRGIRSETGARFASLLQRELTARTDLLDCGSHGKTWDILRRTRMPAVRLELGYLTHPGDAARLADPGFRDVVAESVVVAVQRLYLPPADDTTAGSILLPDLVG